VALYERPDPTHNPYLKLLEANGYGHQAPHDDLPIIDWATDGDPSAELVDGFALVGRWTAIAAAAKAGKSSLLVSASVEMSLGRHPFDATPIAPVRVLYIDAEMGRLDLRERLEDCGYRPAELALWSACDIPPRLDTIDGAGLVLEYVQGHGVQCVVIDGINGTVSGSERDDEPWRKLFEHTVRPLKEMGVAIITADNHGKDAALGPRGSSVKMDKADAVLILTRTANGVSLHASHRRTAAYPLDTTLEVFGIEGDEPLRYRRAVGAAYPDGTKEVAELLAELGVPDDMGRDKVRLRLRSEIEQAEARGVDPDRYRVRNATLSAAIRWRKEARMRLGTGKNAHLGTPMSGPTGPVAPEQVGQVPGTAGTGGLTCWGAGGGGGRPPPPPPPSPTCRLSLSATTRTGSGDDRSRRAGRPPRAGPPHPRPPRLRTGPSRMGTPARLVRRGGVSRRRPRPVPPGAW
jgi:hypothetical protein